MQLDRHQIDGFMEHYDGCIVSIGGEPFYISGGSDRRSQTVTAHKVTDDALGEAQRIRMSDVEHYELPAGFYQLGGSPIVVFRSPERSVKRGLCSQNTIAGVVTSANVPLEIATIGIDFNRWPSLIKAYSKPPTYSSDDWNQVNATIRAGHNAGMAIGSQFAVVKRKGKDGMLPTLIMAGGPVGRVTPKMEIVLHPKLSYLKDNLDASIQTSFKKGEAPNVSVG